VFEDSKAFCFGGLPVADFFAQKERPMKQGAGEESSYEKTTSIDY